jgi:MATE family multidrug resistance protein
MEWWTFEILTLLAGSMGVTQLASQNILASNLILIFMFTYGISIAGQTLIGNALGEGLPAQARVIGACTVLIAQSCALSASAIAFGIRWYVGGLYTHDADVQELVGHLTQFMCIFVLLDSLQGTCQAILRGTGRQFYGAVSMSVSCYLIEIPAAFVLAKYYHIDGMWWGMLAGYVVMASGLLMIVLRLDWQKAAEQAIASGRGAMSEPALKGLNE